MTPATPSAPRPPRIRAVVFDLDGVLIETEQLWDEVREQLAAEVGARYGAAEQRAMMGMSSPEWSAYMEELGVPGPPAAINDEVVRRLIARYRERLPLIPGAVDAVRRLAAAGYTLAVASSSNRELIDLVLAESGLAPLFAATVSSEEVPRGKPSPDVYAEACRRIGVAPAEAAAVEDSHSGIRSAQAAGLRVLAIPNAAFPPGADALALADLVLPGLDALTPAAVEGFPRVITRHHHTSLFVTDLDRSVAFYRDALGFELLTHEPGRGGDFLDQVCNHPGTRLDFALLRLGDFVIELMVPLAPAGLPTDANAQRHGIARIGFEVEEIEETVSALQARGVEFMSEIATLPTAGVKHYAGGKAVFFRDPDGIILELQQPARKGAVT